MKRITIEVSEAEHQQVKAKALLEGKTMKEFILDSTLRDTPNDENDAMAELVALLDARSANARRNGVSKRTVGEIFQSVCERKGINPDG